MIKYIHIFNRIIIIILMTLPLQLLSQTLDPNWKKTIVLFEVQRDSTQFIPIGTGFLIKYKTIDYLVTNKHIATNNNLYIRVNLKDTLSSSLRFSIDEMRNKGKVEWILSKTADIAIIRMLISKKYQGKTDTRSIGISLMKNWDYLNESDQVLILGFPLGLGTFPHYIPVIRSGIISLKSKKGEFIIDANIFPGNSGGPIFLRPQLYDSNRNSMTLTESYLIGIVQGYIPYIDHAISTQTNRTRITFEENSGLSTAYSTDFLLELLQNNNLQ